MSKPVVYLANIGRDDYVKQKNKYLPRIQAWIKANGGGPMIPYSAEILQTAGSPELEARNKAAADIKEGTTTMIPKITNVGYKAL